MRERKRRHRGVEETRELLAWGRERGLSGRQLAEELGVHPNTVGNWTRREREEAAARRTPSTSAPGSRAVTLVPVRVVNEAGTCDGERRPADRPIEIVLEGANGRRTIVVRLADGFRAGDLHTVFSVIGASAC